MNQIGTRPVQDAGDNPLRRYILGEIAEFEADTLEEQFFADPELGADLDASEFELLRDEVLGVLPASDTERLRAVLKSDGTLRIRREFVVRLVAAVTQSVADLGSRIGSYAPMLERMFRRRQPQYAEDLTNETIARALQKGRGLLLPGAELGKYLSEFARNITFESHRDRLSPVGNDIELEQLAKICWNPLRLSHLDSTILTKEVLHMAFQTMTEANAKTFIEYYAGDREELAKTLGVTPQTLRVRVHRLLSQLREALRAQSS